MSQTKVLARCTILAGASLLALGVATPVLAQEAAPAAPEQASNPDAPAAASGVAAPEAPATAQVSPATDAPYQDIVVTAQRRSENKQDVPVTLTVLSGAQIEDARIQSVQDLVTRTPGFGFDTYPASEPRLSIRGVGSSARGAGGDPSVALFIDEVYYGRPAAIVFETYDVERVEILKGPQGTLFGRNVAGGAVSVVTTPPSLTAFDASAEATYGNYNRADGAGFVNVPLADGTAALRVTGTYRRHDGYVDRIVNGEKQGAVDDQDSAYGRIQLRVEPATNFQIDLKADYARDRGAGPGNRVLLDTGDGGLSGLFVPNTDRYENAATFDGRQDRDTWGLRSGINWDLPFASVRYIGSYRELYYHSFYDFDGGAAPEGFPAVGIQGGNNERTSFYSNEVQLRSSQDSAFSWVAGLYQYHAQTFRDQPSQLTFDGEIGVFDTVAQNASADSKAVYGDVTIPITDTVNVFGGVRYTWDKKSVRTTGNTNEPGTFFTVGDPDTPGFYVASANDRWNAPTWRGGADWHITSDLMVYASVSRGFKSGGYQDTPVDSADARTSVPPEFATNYEFGQRGAFFDHHLIWNNTVYYTKYTDLQTRILTGFGYRADNASAEIYGLESELTLRFGGFVLGSSYAYTHARYTDFPTEADGVNVNYAGNQLTRVPEHKVTVSPAYKFTLGSGATLLVSGDYAYEGRIYDDHNNLPPAIRSPTNFFDARAVFTTADKHWSLSVWGKNITNEKTRTYQGQFSGVLFGAYNPPATYGATVRWSY